MAKKSRRKAEQYTTKNEEEWGKEFGKKMEKWGESFGRRMERRGKVWQKEWKERWFWPLGFIGPLIKSIFGIIGLVILVWILKFINLPLGNSFISGLSNFLLNNLHWFFVASIFFGYNRYFSWRFKKNYWIVAPVTTSICIVIALWIAILLLNFLNTFIAISTLAYASNILYAAMFIIFIIFIVLGYLTIIIKKLFIDFFKV
jgi:uncharacterized membrane protein